MRTLLWFRGKDLRLRDHAALRGAMESRELLPVFVLSPRYFAKQHAAGPPHRLQFMLESLAELAAELEARGSRLLIVDGPAKRAIPELAKACAVDRVLAQASCEPASRARDAEIERALQVPFEIVGGETLLEPGSLRSSSGGMFQVYGAFARAAQAALAQANAHQQPSAAAKRLPPLPPRLDLRERPLPTLESAGIAKNEHVQAGGARAAHVRLRKFLAGPVQHYESDRNRMDRAGTSRLSADLHFGTLSVREVWSALNAHERVPADEAERFRLELLWREFAHHLLWHRPELLSEPFRRDFHGFPWLDDDAGFEAWWRGETGYPVVDASARQLLAEGYVHNRARMISASFLTKHLLINYQRGEAHFLQYLTDGDLANNNLGWQWSAGCGCDAQPYFRIFNPVTQGTRFDPEGEYVRRYVPELARLPARYIHSPWTAPADVLNKAGVTLGANYPEPIVEHTSSRQRFLLLANEHLKAQRAKHA